MGLNGRLTGGRVASSPTQQKQDVEFLKLFYKIVKDAYPARCVRFGGVLTAIRRV